MQNDLIEKKIEWWVNHITSPTDNWDNGDKSFTGLLTNSLGNRLASAARTEITAEMLDNFRLKLKELINKEIAQGQIQVLLSCDYNPGIKLREAASFAKISEAVFPCKSFSRLDLNTNVLEGKVGYYAQIKPI